MAASNPRSEAKWQESTNVDKRIIVGILAVVLLGIASVGVTLVVSRAYSDGVQRGMDKQTATVNEARADADAALKEAKDARRELQSVLDETNSKLKWSYYRGFYDLCNAVLLGGVSETERTREFIDITINKCIGYTKQVLAKDAYSVDSVGYEFVYATE
jgi:hypothetical protein